MSNLALLEVQRALYTKLTGDGVLMGMVTDVFDVVPQKTALPYVEIGDGDYSAIAADAANLSEVRMQLDVWTDAAGRKTALNIMNRMYALLHFGTLTLAGYQQVLMRCEQAETALVEEAARIRGSLVVRVAVVE